MEHTEDRWARQATNEISAAMEVARLAKAAGGRALLVGGCVRDSILGVPVKDIDVEVFGVAPEVLKETLSRRFDLDLVGQSFGVIKLHHLDVDVSLPRRESKRGTGHKGFDIDSDPNLSVAEAASRRDFTVNAIYRDPLNDELIDPWGGVEDLRRRRLRHVSDKFAEDPLRVLRGMQFIARFGLAPAPETVAVCSGIDPEGLPPERQFEEWAKLLVKGVDISRGLAFLRATGWVRHYPELAKLIGCRQAPEWHPEGDVWNHTCCCLDAFARRREGRRRMPGEERDEDLMVGLAVLCHDFGKPATSRWDRKMNRIRSIGHDQAGVKPTLSFLRRLTNEERILRLVPPLVQFHMAPFAYWKSKASDAAIRRLALKVGSVQRLIRVAQADDEGRPPYPPEPEPLEWLAAAAERLRVAASAPRPMLMGRHLIRMGYRPGPQLGRWLNECFEAQLDGAFTDLDGAIEYFRQHIGKEETT